METNLKEQGQTGTGQQGAKNHAAPLFPNVNIPLSTITSVFYSHAKRAVSNSDKKCLYGMAYDLGAAITNHAPAVTKAEWLTACGIKPEWGEIAA